MGVVRPGKTPNRALAMRVASLLPKLTTDRDSIVFSGATVDAPPMTDDHKLATDH